MRMHAPTLPRLPVSPSDARAPREVAPWIERLARLGYVAKAVLYGTIAVLAGAAALGERRKAGSDSHDAFTTIIGAPFGRALLGVVAVGLAGYAIWRLVAGVTDAEGRGSKPKGIALRLSQIGSGLIHLALAYTAIKLVTGNGGGESGSDRSEHWSARAMSTPGGIYVLWSVAGAFVAYGAYQLYKAWRAKLSKQLDLGRMSREAGRWVIGVSRFGIAARGIVFGMIGVLLARAAREHDPKEAGGTADSMRALFAFGKWPFLAIAAGLLAYAGYQLLNARYRRIRVPT